MIEVGQWPTFTVVEFEWDEAKSDQCFRQRGFDFAYAVRTFVDPHRIIGPDHRQDYGEDRFRLLREIEGRVFVLIYTLRGPSMRIISARKANRREVTEYENDERAD